MCGIAGIFNMREPRSIDPWSLFRMISVLKHRGPDESGIFIDKKAGLASSRLSIIDLERGTQPIQNEDGTLWIVYNGEIFNYIELRNKLKKKHTLYTSTDTEVILHLYEEKGEKCVEELNGEFAIAIYDMNKSELFLARDRFAIKPLYYSIYGDQLLFASEIKSILTFSNSMAEVDTASLDQLFTFWTTLPGRSFFRGVYELPAAHYLKISSGRIKLNRYWDIPHSLPEVNDKIDTNAFSQELTNLLTDSVRIRMRSDVPVGCYLSGGLDSSFIASIIKKRLMNDVLTFGISFNSQIYDESSYQKEMAEFLRVSYSSAKIDITNIYSNFSKAIWYCESPVLRTAPVPMLMLSELVHKSGLKVVMTGEGADEIFYGYDIFKEAKARSFWAKRPASPFRPLLLERIYPYIYKNKKFSRVLLQFYKNGLGQIDDPFFSHSIRWNNTARLKMLYSASLREELSGYDSIEELKTLLPPDFERKDLLSRAQYLEIILFLNKYLLCSQGDRMAMASSVETRMPYLDHRIIELMAGVPAGLKLKGMQEKYILKKSAVTILPDNIIRRRKFPYRSPAFSHLISKGNLFSELFTADFFKDTGLFDEEKARKLFNRIESHGIATESDDMAVAGLLSTKYLYDHFLNSKTRFRPAPGDISDLKLFIDRRHHEKLV